MPYATKEKRAAYAAVYRAAHREEIAAYDAAYYAAHCTTHRERKAARDTVYRAAHREERLAYNAVYRLKRKYGLSPAARAEMLAAQSGLCAGGCGMPATKVDHCHDCEDIDLRGSVRGLLCHPCNMYLDHIARFSPMHAAYIATHNVVCPALAEAVA